MLAEPISITLLVIDAFDRLGISYLIGGSLASALYGSMRSTLDADLVADVQLDHVSTLVKLLENTFYVDQNMIIDAVEHKSSFNLIHLTTTFKVDVFIMKSSRFEQMQFQRRQLQTISDNPPRQAYVASPEDIILAKLAWYRLGNEVSDRQWKDILGVLKIRAGQLDLDYLRQWASELRVTDLLIKAFQETGS
jgi:hypothetical protein